MIASLPMYWRAETADGWLAFWELVRQEGANDIPVLTPPEKLTSGLYEHWRDPSLFLSMTCGYPFRTALRNDVTYVGTLDFGVNAAPGFYHSKIVVKDRSRLEDGGLRLAVNSRDSQSGWACIMDPKGDFPDLDLVGYIETGGHAESVTAVAEGRTDIAFIDAVTWRLLERFDPVANTVHAVGQTSPTPGLPLIASKSTDVGPLRHAIANAVSKVTPRLSSALGGLRGFVVLDSEDYFAVPDLSPIAPRLP